MQLSRTDIMLIGVESGIRLERQGLTLKTNGVMHVRYTFASVVSNNSTSNNECFADNQRQQRSSDGRRKSSLRTLAIYIKIIHISDKRKKLIDSLKNIFSDLARRDIVMSDRPHVTP